MAGDDREQPEVYAKMRAHRDQFPAMRERGQIPILFGVHETIRRHADTGMTRLFYDQGFDESWFDGMPSEARRQCRNHLRYRSAFAHVVLDEVSPSDLVSIHGAAEVRWAQQFKHSVQRLHESDKLGRYLAFKKYRVWHPRHRENDATFDSQSDWQFIEEILHAHDTEDDLVELTAEKFPFDDDAGMYKGRLGPFYYVRPLFRWDKFVRTTLLTTELVPAQIVEALRRRSTMIDQIDGRQRWQSITPAAWVPMGCQFGACSPVVPTGPIDSAAADV